MNYQIIKLSNCQIRNLKILALIIFAAALLFLRGMSAAGFGFMQQRPIVFNGQNALVPAVDGGSGAGVLMRQDGPGITADSVSAVSIYCPFAKSVSTCVIDCVIKINAGYGGTPSNQHGGLGVAWVDDSNLGACVMPNLGTGNLDIRELVGGSEKQDDIVGVGCVANHEYRLRIDFTNATPSATNCTVNFWDNQTGSHLVTDYVHNFHSSIPTNGLPFIHSFAASVTVLSCAVYQSDGVTIISTGPQLFAGVSSSSGSFENTGPTISKGVATVNAGSSWHNYISPVFATDCTITGFIRPVSGRAPGVAFRTSASGNGGYGFYYDDSLNQLRLAINLASPSVVPGPLCTLTAGTEYPFTVTVRGSVFTFTINGVTMTVSDSTYTAGGYVGPMNFGSQADYRNWTVLP